MKKLLAAIVITLPFTLNVQAKEEKDFGMIMCKPMHGLAEAIMANRQKGVSIVKMRELTGNTEIEFITTFSTYMINKAYDSPRFHTKENQHRATQDFANDMFMECMKIAEGL